jgi:periplasmic divalent cation tolerance protein
VELRLAACASVVAKVHSTYRWKGAVEQAEEWLLALKTRRSLFERLKQEIAALHSYEVPEIIALPVVDGLESYLSWIEGETDDSHK